MKQKNKKGGFLSILLGALSASLLANLLTGKGTIKAGENTVRAGQDFSCRFILKQTLKYKIIIKIYLNLVVFIQEIIYLK